MNNIFSWVENTWLSEWVTGPAFLWILTAHTLSIGLFAGLFIMQAILKWAASDQFAFGPEVQNLYWAALVASLISGVLLICGYPYKALTNWVFYAKIAALIAAMVMLKTGITKPKKRFLLVCATITLFGVIAGGRLLGYTYSTLYAP